MARLNWGQVVRPVVSIVLIGILALFAHAGVSGDHGLGALKQAEVLEGDLKLELAALTVERKVLANKVARLGDDYLDLDLLDERSRIVLGRIRNDEIIID